MHPCIDRVSHLIEAFPYIRRFCGKTFVVKCGGAAIADEIQMQKIMQDIALLHFCGIQPIIIHGGGPEISTMCGRLEVPTQFSNGQRVTDASTMEIVQMVLVGKINGTLVGALNQLGVKAVGLSGQDSAFLQVQKFTSKEDVLIETDLGFVGDIVGIDTTLITTLLAAGFVPVIAPIGVDSQGQIYNINADIAAGALAGALAAEKLIILSDVNGVYADVNDPMTRLNSVKMKIIKQWLQEGDISGGMIPKLQSCVQAIEQGVSSAHILDGKMQHSLLLETFTDEGVGTLITA
jgi:acetylglutamate kinase